MIGLLALALQAAATSQLDTVTVTRFQTTAETQPMILYYANCLSPEGVARSVSVTGTAEADAKARIAACSRIRAWALSAGISVYRPEPGGDPDARHYMNASLDQVEQGYLADARFSDDLTSGKIDPSTLSGQPIVLPPDAKPPQPRSEPH
jgi:hypothetical protein